MAERLADIDAFLTQAGWGNAARHPLAGDASARRYLRLTQNGQSAILMDSPSGPETQRFVRIGTWLTEAGFSAPRLLAENAGQGLLLLEDLGDDLIAQLVAKDPAQEAPLYAAITDFLTALHRVPAPDFLPDLGAMELADLVRIVPDWYPCRSATAADEVPERIAALYSGLNREAPVMCLRDFHAENILWLPDRAGPARLGLLDFQDAVRAHPAYDLVSVLQDARRAVSAQTETAERQRYASQNMLEQGRFDTIYALLGVQRSLRIVGIFARLCMAMGKAHYVDLIPRSWSYIERNLSHPALEPLARVLFAAYPRPDQDILNRIKDKCGTLPMR